MTDYEVIWNGDVRGPGRGHLGIVPDVLRQPPPELDQTLAPVPEAWNGKRQQISALTSQGRQILMHETLSARQLRQRLGCEMSALQSVLMRLRREGSLQVQLVTRAEQRTRGLKYAGQVYRVRTTNGQAA